MLRRAAAPAYKLLSKNLSSTTRPRLHQPLGSVPQGIDIHAVRAKWGSDAMDQIQNSAPIEVDGPVAICDGGGGALGHPIEYIKLMVADGSAGPQVCKYCGLKYVMKRS